MQTRSYRKGMKAMGKIEDAVRKINDEIQKEPGNAYIAAVGEHIIDCITTEEAAEAVLAEGKTLSGALAEMHKDMEERARRKRSELKKGENCVEIVAPKEEVFKMARDHFGLPEPGTRPAAKKGVSLSLEDFL